MADVNWQRGDIVLDDTGNMFDYHPTHGWHSLASNQSSARGPYDYEDLAQPLTLLVRDHRPVGQVAVHPVEPPTDGGVTITATQPSLWYFNTDRAGHTTATELTGLINNSPDIGLSDRERAFAVALITLAADRLTKDTP